MSPFGEEESALSSRQRTDLYVSGTDGQIQWIPLRIASPSSIFARFSLLRLFSVSKLEEFGGKRFIIREHLIAETEAYFEELDKSYYLDGLRKLEDQAEKRLCWEIKMNRKTKKKMYFTMFF